MTEKPTVLFVCVHNAGRSQMAAGRLRAPTSPRTRRAARQDAATVRRIRDEIRERVEVLIDSLPAHA